MNASTFIYIFFCNIAGISVVVETFFMHSLIKVFPSSFFLSFGRVATVVLMYLLLHCSLFPGVPPRVPGSAGDDGFSSQ